MIAVLCRLTYLYSLMNIYYDVLTILVTAASVSTMKTKVIVDKLAELGFSVEVTLLETDLFEAPFDDPVHWS